jgi:hypothetical protein
MELGEGSEEYQAFGDQVPGGMDSAPLEMFFREKGEG